MNKIITRPGELSENPRVLYAGNHYLSLPEIDPEGGIHSLNVISLANKGLIELRGSNRLLSFSFSREDSPVEVSAITSELELNYIPVFVFELADGTKVTLRIYADLTEKGCVFDFEASHPVQVTAHFALYTVNVLRFNAYPVEYRLEMFRDRWLDNPVVRLSGPRLGLSLAFGGDHDFSCRFQENTGRVEMQLNCSKRNCLYLALNSDPDGASTTLIHLRRKHYQSIYTELKTWLQQHRITGIADQRLEERLNQNLFYNYFFAIGKDLDTDQYTALTSRSPRYYVSGAFWERDSFLWSMPAIRLTDPELHRQILRQLILTHSRNAGDHAHYIDGTVLYPGFELDEAASYFIATIGQPPEFFDREVMAALERVYRRIEQEYDPDTGLYKTFLLPSDDPAEYPLVTIDNVLLWRAWQQLLSVYQQQGQSERAEQLRAKITSLKESIYKHLVHTVNGREMFVWSADGRGNYRLYNDPPGNLGLLCYYGFVSPNDQVFRNTIAYYYSHRYHYYRPDASYPELACDHHPNTPSGLGLCGSLLNPLRASAALKVVREAELDHGLLCESFDYNTGAARTGVGFATGAGYLAMALYHALVVKSQ